MASPKTRGRMINRDISDSKGFAKLSPEAAVLFVMMIPHFSPYGKLNGDPGYLKGGICPRVKYLTVAKIPKLLEEITEHTSVKWFEYDGRYWIHSLNFITEHQNINLERAGPDLLPSYSGISTPSKYKEKEKENMSERPDKPVAPTCSDNDYVRKVKVHYNTMIDDPEQTKQWREYYNGSLDIDSALFAACTWLVEHPRKRRSDFKQFYGNWLRNSYQRVSERRLANA